MDFVLFYIICVFFIGLTIIVLLLWRDASTRWDDERRDLLNRIMATDYQVYRQAEEPEVKAEPDPNEGLLDLDTPEVREEILNPEE